MWDSSFGFTERWDPAPGLQGYWKLSSTGTTVCLSPCRLVEKPELRVLPVPESECQRVPEPASGPAVCPSLPHFPCASASRFFPAKTGLVFPENILLFLKNRAQFITNQTLRGQALESMQEGLVVLLLVVEGGRGSTPIGPLLLYGRETGLEKGKVTQTHREGQGWLGLHLRNSPK